MCGIAGIAGPGAENEKPLVSAMLQALAHRGPDDEGVYSDAGVLLGHRRLSILDLSAAGHQPMRSADGRFALTFNGEIYNYRELRSELEACGARFRSQTDTEVLLAAWSQWGEGCVERLNGMWAFALWDHAEHVLYASRDRFGKKPFYYVQLKERLYFASEMKALLRVPGLKRSLNVQALADFAVDRVIGEGGGTFIQEIASLPPASNLVWKMGRVAERRYWDFPADGSPGSGSVQQMSLSALLQDAVRLRLRADVPVGCLLSGGLDSSTIAALMRQQSNGRPVHLFTTRTDPPARELHGVDALLGEGGFVAHVHRPDAKGFWADLPELIWHQEAPFADGSMGAHFALMREARNAGVPVVLTGQGADELFAGYPTFLWRWIGGLWRHGRWPEALAVMRRASAQHSISYGSVGFHAAPAGLRRWVRRWRSARAEWLAPEFRQAADTSERWEDLATPEEELNAAQRRSVQRWTLPGFLQYEDRNAMTFGVETRLPFLDYRLAEALWALPPGRRFFDGRTKALLREAARPWLPELIVNGTVKEGYPAPLAFWLRELAPQLRAAAAATEFRACPFLNYPVWLKNLERFLAGDSRQLESTWRGFVAVLWYQRFIQDKAL